MRISCILTAFVVVTHAAYAANQQHPAMDLARELEATFAQSASLQLDDRFIQSRIVAHAGNINAIAGEVAATNEDSVIMSARAVSADEGYNEEEKSNWSQTCWLPAQCFIKPRSTPEVAVIFKIITSLGAKFAVRSGGHNPGPGFASIGSEGVLIDLSELNQVALSADKSYVSLGPGATWDKVYNVLERSELTVVGGRVAGVGVGGLILGGGMSHFSNHWGMVADNVKDFEIVLADSRIINANKDSNPDLFRVLKGGGPNFGIVTRFNLFTKPDYKLWYTTKAYSTEDVGAVMAAAVEVEKNMVDDDKAGFFLTTTPTALVAGMLYRDWVRTRPAAFAPFDDITPIAIVMPETNGTEESSAIAQTQDQVGKRASGTVSLEPDAELYANTLDILKDVVKTTPNVSLVHTFQPLGAPSIAKSESLGGNILNVKPVSQSWLAVAAFWTNDSDNTVAVEQTQLLIKRIKAAAAEAGKLIHFDFMNDANFAQSPLKHYGDMSISLMEKAAARYDPDGVFQKLQRNGFLLSRKDQATVP